MSNPKYSKFESKIEEAINSLSLENESNTPDFVLAKFLSSCFDAFNIASIERENFYGQKLRIGSLDPSTKAKEIAARIWQDQEMTAVIMDCDACHQIARIIDSVIRKESNNSTLFHQLDDDRII